MKKKICYVIGELKLAGAETLLYNIIKNLDKEKYEVYLVYSKRGDFYDAYTQLNITMIQLNLTARLKNIKNINRFMMILIHYKIDVLHIHLVGNFLFSLTAGLLANVKNKIIHWHNVYNKENLRINRIFSIWLGSRLANKIIAISDEVKNYNASNYRIKKRKVTRIYNCVDLNKFPQQSYEAKNLVIGTIGRLTNQKGYPLLIKVMQKVVRRYPTIVLEIIGEGPLEKKILTLCKEYNIIKNVKLLGNIPYDKIQDKISSWKLFVLTSEWEGFGLVLIEAMACNLPVVATNVDAIPEIVVNGETGLLADFNDVDKLNTDIIELISNDEKNIIMGINGRKRVEEYFSIDKYIYKLEKIY